MYRDGNETKQADEYDVTLLVTHEPPTVVDENFTLVLKYYVILSSKREVYPRLLAEKKSGKFRTVSTVAPPVRWPVHNFLSFFLFFSVLLFMFDLSHC
jgi:hypothetical protein